MFAHITNKLYLCIVKIKQQQLNDQGYDNKKRNSQDTCTKDLLNQKAKWGNQHNFNEQVGKRNIKEQHRCKQVK